MQGWRISSAIMQNTSDKSFSRTPSNNFLFCLVALTLVVLAFVVRSPEVFSSPRFWAEEGSLWFREAYQSGFIEHLFFLPQRTAGYFLIGPNLSTALGAHAVDIEYAPYITLAFSLLIQLMPFAIVLTGSSKLWDTPLRKFFVCLIILFAPSNSIEAWLNTINSQVYSGLTVACILLEPTRSFTKLRTIIFCLILTFSGLNGIYATFLAPCFLIKCFRERSKASVALLMCSWITALVQVGAFLYLLRTQALSSKKFSQGPAIKFDQIVIHHWLVPILGNWAGRYFNIFSRYSDNLFLLCAGVLTAITFWKRKDRKEELLLLFLGFLIVSFLTAFASVGGVPGGRYGVLPGYLFLLLLYTQIDIKLAPKRSFFVAFLLITSLFHGLRIYRQPYSTNRQKCPPVHCPRWSEEVETWRKDPTYLPRIWPTDWSVRLVKK